MTTKLEKFAELRDEIRAAVVCASFAKENRTDDNEINWNFVDSDVCIEFGNYFDLIGEILNEVATEIAFARVNSKVAVL
jgi:hypothetical protein